MKDTVNGGTRLERKPQQWVKVMGRLSDPKARKRKADMHLKDTGHKLSDPDQFNFYMGFSVQSYGFKGAFEEAEAYIAEEQIKYLDQLEWKITGGEW
jgi:hypothetical protein